MIKWMRRVVSDDWIRLSRVAVNGDESPPCLILDHFDGKRSVVRLLFPHGDDEWFARRHAERSVVTLLAPNVGMFVGFFQSWGTDWLNGKPVPRMDFLPRRTPTDSDPEPEPSP